MNGVEVNSQSVHRQEQIVGELRHKQLKQQQPNFGLLFDIDGVLGRGTNVLPQAVEAFKLLCDPTGKELLVPVAFVTNTAGSAKSKAQMLSKWFGVEIGVDQLILAPTPLTVFKEYQTKRALFIGQEGTLDIAHSLGFVNAVTLEDVKAAYPLLDMVDHENRTRVARKVPEAKPLGPIDVIILIGEPTHWESNLQLLIDLLLTDGKPDHVPAAIPKFHIPVIACNMDLVFMHRAVLPRFGHGAFLACLEALYRQFTGRELRYTSLLGKPSEITFRYAEHIVNVIAHRLGYTKPIEHLYFFGDNPDVDVLGSNLYNSMISRYRHVSGENNGTGAEHHRQREERAAVCSSRAMPSSVKLMPQTARIIDSVLVHTGVYKPTDKNRDHQSFCHRDFMGSADLVRPVYEVNDCLEAIRLILDQNQFHPSSENTTTGK